MSTATVSRPAPFSSATEVQSGRRRKASPRRAWQAAPVIAVLLAIIAAALRLFHITTSYDLFIDEATYAAIARDTTLGTGPLLHGLPFVVHPPLALLLLAGPEQVLGTQDVAALVSDMRPFVALVGAITVAVLYLTLHQAGLRKAALAAAALVALDPLIISFDSRVMLEAIAQLFAVVTVAAAIRATNSDSQGRWRWIALTAVAGAATFGTKETFGLVILATLIVSALTAARGQRRPLLQAVLGMLVGYALVNVVMIHWAGFALWWHMRTDGLSRLLGHHQATGFKAEGVQGSFWDRVLPNGAELGATYAILAIGGLCAISLLWGVLRRRRSFMDLAPAVTTAVQIVAVWAVCACGYVAYAVAFGSLEEQMFYIAAAPCAAALAIRVFLITQRFQRRLAGAGLVAILLMQGTAWVTVHTSADDVYAQMLTQIPNVASAGSTISVTEETAQFVLTGYDLGQWVNTPDLAVNDVDYVLLSDRLVTLGYGLADQDFAETVREHGSLVMTVEGRENDLQLYDVRGWIDTLEAGASTSEGAS